MAVPRPRNTFDRSQLYCIGAIYVTITAAAALMALSVDRSWATFAILLLLPVVVLGGLEAFRAGNQIWQEWRATQLGANVKRALALLGPGYQLVTRGDRDGYVAIGPNGIFLVLSSDDGGRVTASDQRLFVNARLPWRNMVEDCRVEALRVSDRVQRALGRPVPVHAVLCFTRALVAVGQEIRGVKIVQVPRLARLITSIAATTTLADEDVRAARAALVTPPTVSPLRPVFRITRRRQGAGGERPLSLVGRSTTPQQRRRS